MARKVYQEVHADVQGEFDSVILTTNLESLINIKILGDENQKKEVIKVKKTDDLNYHEHKVDVFLTVNQGIFEQLTPPQKVLAIETALANIGYNYDKDMLVSTPVDIKAHSGVLRKHSFESYEVLQESIKTLYAKAAGEDKVQ